MNRSKPARLAILAICALLVACAGPQPPGGDQPGSTGQTGTPKRITAAILGNPHTLSESINGAGTGSIRGVDQVEKLIGAGLTMFNGEGNRIPQLAEQVPTPDNGLWKVLPDGRMETTWRIRDGARWHDGTPVTSADVLFTAEVARDQDLALTAHPAYASIDQVTAPDERTVTVTWKEPFIDADQLFSYEVALILPKHLLESEYRSNKAAFLELPYWTTGYVGAGPFRVREFVRDSHMVVEAYDDYVLGRPKLDEITIRFISDPNTLIANVLSGDVELSIGRGLNIEQAFEVDQQWTNGHVASSPSNWIAHYPQLMTPDPAIIGDPRFRTALLQAIDRESMSQSLQGGQAPVAHTVLWQTAPEYAAVESEIVKYQYDPRQAEQTMSELGYTRGSDGFYVGPNGQRLVVESRTNAGDDLKEKMLLTIGDYWQRLGVAVNSVISPRQLASTREYRATNPGFDLVRQPFDLRRFHSEEIPLPENNWVGANRIRYSNPELDALIDRYYTTIPRTQRLDILGDALHIISDQVVALGIFYGPEPILISDRLVNVAPARGADADETWNAHLWDFR